MKKVTKCYIYTHVSTANQVDGYSLDAQKEKIRKYAEYEDMTIAGEYSDRKPGGIAPWKRDKRMSRIVTVSVRKTVTAHGSMERYT